MDDKKRPNIENRGISMGRRGKFKAKKIKITINPPATGDQLAATTKSPFRFNIPTPTKHFKGRTEILEAVRYFFNNLPVQTVDCLERIFAIVGLGGMGKTETAYKFAAEFVETSQSVAWINAETETNALASFLGLAKYLKLVKNDHKEADLDLVRQVYRHIDEQDYGCTLFIFDNALRLNSGEEEFGIYKYLPVDDLINKRFPNILITTQTQDWERGIKTIQVDTLSEEESLEFFRSTFRIQSTECDDLFKTLHKLFEGYPLVMNLAASQIDYNPNNDSVGQLRDQIQSYIYKLKKEQSKLLNEKFNRVWPTRYQKTLSNVWKLTFERIQQEDQGTDALEILQCMSFLRVPIYSDDVVDMLACRSECPLPSRWKLYVQMEELFRVLERFYTVRKLEVDHLFDGFPECELAIHRLLQLVVRQQMDPTKDLERVLFYFARDWTNNPRVNKSALEEALQRSQLTISQTALPYVGILACKGYPTACKIIKTRKSETKAVATIWRLYDFKQGTTTFSENEIEVLHELVQLTKCEGLRQDRVFFIDITLNLLTDNNYLQHTTDDRTEVKGYLHLDTYNGVEELAVEFIQHVNSVQGSSCNCDSSYCQNRKLGLSAMTVWLTKKFIQEDAPNSKLTPVFIADTWFALFARNRYIVSCLIDRDEFCADVFWKFWEDMYEVFHWKNASQSRTDELKTCLWDRGLAEHLRQIFEFVSCEWALGGVEYWNNVFVPFMDVCMDGMDLKETLVQQVISLFCKMITKIEPGYLYTLTYDDVHFPSDDELQQWVNFAVDLCSVWIKLFLMGNDPSSSELLQSLSSLKFLDWMQSGPGISLRPFFSNAMEWIPREYLSEYFPKFIQRFSSSEFKVIQTLLNVCRQLVEAKRV